MSVLTRREIIDAIRQTQRVRTERARRIVDEVFECVGRALADNREVCIRSVGRFRPSTRTMKSKWTASTRVGSVKFRASSAIRASLVNRETK